MDKILALRCSFMRFCLTAAILLALLLPAGVTPPTLAAPPSTTTPDLADAPAQPQAAQPDLPAGVSQEWWASVKAMIAHEMHFVAPAATTDGEAGDGYTAFNPKTNLQISFPASGGFWVTTAPPAPDRAQPDALQPDAAQPAPPDWRWGLRPESVSIGAAVYSLGQPQPAAVTDNRLEQVYSLTDGSNPHTPLTEWFVNDSAGLRQNFTLATRPPGAADQPLMLHLTALGDLTGGLDADGQGVTVRDAAGSARLVYNDLHIFDATGRNIPGHFALDASPSQPTGLAIVVADAGAVYPLPLDPLPSTRQILEIVCAIRSETPSSVCRFGSETPSSEMRE